DICPLVPCPTRRSSDLLAVPSTRRREGLAVAADGAGVPLEGALVLADFGADGLDPVCHRYGRVASCGGLTGGLGAVLSLPGFLGGLDLAAHAGIGAGEISPVPCLGVVAYLDRLAAFGQGGHVA